MTEMAPELLRISFELPRDDLPELMEHLGSLAFAGDLDIKITNAAEEAPKSYNPVLVSQVTEYGTQLEHSAITLTSLKKFASTLDMAEGDKNTYLATATKIHNAFSYWYYYPARDQVDISDYFVQLSGRTATDKNRQIAVKADHAEKMLNHLNNRELKRRGIGQSAIGFFATVCDNLYEKPKNPDN